MAGRVLTAVLSRPVPLVLLAMGIFYLWIYWRCIPTNTGKKPERDIAKQRYPHVSEHSMCAK